MTTHLSKDCDWPDGHPCEDCIGEDTNRCAYNDAEELAATFARDWDSAPRSYRNYVEQSVAEYWWHKGRQAQHTHTETLIEDVVEMRRLVEARLTR